MLDGFAVQDNGIPIYVQLRDQILALLGRGVLRPGSRLPTMRQVAVDLKIDLNTVQHAYAELERDGVLTKSRGIGTFITQAPPLLRDVQKHTQDFAFRIAAQAQSQGIDLKNLATAMLKLADETS